MKYLHHHVINIDVIALKFNIGYIFLIYINVLKKPIRLIDS